MTEITVPNTDDLTLSNLSLDAPAQVNRSIWTGGRKVVGLAGAELWRGSASIDDLATEEEERPWRVFVFGLKGPQNWFRWPLPCASHIGPKPTVASGAGDAYTLPLTGIQPNARILMAGQYMTVPLPSGHNRPVMLMSDLRGDASGNATAEFTPALGEVPVLGATVETVAPFIPMSLTDPRQGFALSEGVSGSSFDVEEARRI
ncbi:hypothetical protein [Allopontixanthobacter sediminis]|uniref:Uncharacterized protein n=1 Tax=Allopontixanthobacter sediminis TaxID=1689985 RepID=A0A845ATV6_9SPHN|nr:hypothetical protein [Allopontixanthobacter sediminis]MXP42993.1 hypothetical protein [Allopontixanthobacter sediminis]